MAEGEKIIPINIEEEMKTAYIDYSMSVIVSRALPDVRDGLKPVHRRVLYGMLDLGVMSNRPYKKSARIVGEVLGKYHPHGDSSVYDTMVRMAQDWSLRYPLVDGQGNFGSIDGDPPAAMRYTEARLRKIAEEMVGDIEKNTVDFRPNFDDSLEEPTVMPTRIPQLLVNGASGIAVGMATNMPPHNLTEIIDATVAYIDNREIDIEGLMKFVKAPDFPTGGTIYGYSGVKDAFETGRGRIVLRGKATIETLDGGRERIIVSEIPYQVNKWQMIKATADLINEKKLEGISDIRDESDRDGMRVVYELKRDAVANVVLNNLYKYTSLQTSFSVNNIALVAGRPEMLNLKNLIHHFVEFRHEVVIRRTKYELDQAEKRAHILQGYLIALDHLDEVIRVIRESATPNEAKEELMKRFSLSEIQAGAILELRLRVLTGMERDKIRAEYDELMKLIDYLKSVLADEGLRMKIIKEELAEIKEKYGDGRRTDIVYAADDQRIEDLIADEDVVITISHLGYIKRTLLSEYRAQNRGGRGSRGSSTRDEDFVEHLFTATTHNYLLFFTEQGRCYWMRAYEVPEGNKTSKGRAIQNMMNLPPGDKVRAYINVKNLNDEEYTNNMSIVMCTSKGVIKKTLLEAYSRPRANGINAITVRDGDRLLEAALVGKNDQVMLASKFGKVVRFNNSDVREMGRTASGVRGMTLGGAEDEIIGMIVLPKENAPQVLVTSEKGYGKRSSVEDYRQTRRGGKGVKTINITEKTGNLVAIKAVTDDNDLMIITAAGIVIRLRVADLRVMGRATQGVRLINLDNNDDIAAITSVETDPEEEHAVVDGTLDTTMADASDEPETDTDADGTDVDNESEEV
ncbi:MAG: DNA gyrase subunit A [Bacteroidetes bacterium]|jgi:DNA gyrase subunit A|nr:DNA gyrase subunit A [Bacteroidota bacterium]